MRKFLKKGAVAAAALALMSTPVFAADEKVIETESVKVTVNRMEQDLHETNVSAAIVTEEEIKRSPALTLAEQLARIPGVSVQDGSMAGLPRVSIRGEGTQRVLLIVDGVRISDQKSMSGPAYLVDPSDIERIEVIKGPASVLYGSEAIGGVINIITKKGGNKPIGGTLQLTYDSSIDSLEPYASVSGRYEGFNYRVSGTYVDAGDRDTPDGKIKYSRYQHTNYSAHVGYDWDWGSVFAGYDYFEGVINVPNNGARAMILDPWERETYKAGLEFNNFSDILLKVRLNGFYQNNLKKQFMSMYIENDMDSYGGTLQTDWLFLDSHYVIFGADWNYDDLDTVTRRGATNMPAEGQQSILGVFLQDEWSVIDQLKIIGGVRYTYVKTETDDWRLGSNDSTDDSWVGNLGVVYMPLDSLALRANVSQGYKSPNLSQQYIGNFMGTMLPNPDLDSEKSTNYEVGLRYNTGAWNVDAALYYADAKDFISSVTITPTQSQYINLDKSQTVGFELGVDYTYEPLGLTPYAVFNWMQRETTNTVSGVKVKTKKSGYPEFTGQLGIKWQRDLFSNHTFFADLNYFWNSNTKDKYYSSTSRRIMEDKAGSFGTVNLNLGFESHHDDCINYFGSLGLRNIMDKKYRLGNTSGLVAPGFHAVATFGVTF